MKEKAGRTLAIIPARGGSKGIPNKNLIKFQGKSLVRRAVSYAVSHPEIDEVVISTDSQEILREALNAGAKNFGLRPQELSGDHAKSLDVWRFELTQAKAHFGYEFQRTVLLEPTSPFRNFADLTHAQKMLDKKDVDGVISVTLTEAHYTPHKSLIRDKFGNLGYYREDGGQYTLRQSIPDIFHRNGLLYLYKTQTIFECSDLLSCDVWPIIAQRPVVNIDTLMDLKFSEFLIANGYAAIHE